jgi:hypothetical protein
MDLEAGIFETAWASCPEHHSENFLFSENAPVTGLPNLTEAHESKEFVS